MSKIIVYKRLPKRILKNTPYRIVRDNGLNIHLERVDSVFFGKYYILIVYGFTHQLKHIRKRLKSRKEVEKCIKDIEKEYKSKLKIR